MKKLAVISILLNNPDKVQKNFNDIISDHKELIRGRLGIPINEIDMSVIGLVAAGEEDRISSLVSELEKAENTKICVTYADKEIN